MKDDKKPIMNEAVTELTVDWSFLVVGQDTTMKPPQPTASGLNPPPISS